MTLAYFTNLYGHAGYTWIMTEVTELRRLGHTVHTFSVRHPGDTEEVSEIVARERSSTDYFLHPRHRARSLSRLAWSTLAMLVRHPYRFASAFVLAERVSPPGVKARVKQVVYLVTACRLARRMNALGVEHLHNHLGSSSASISMLASILADTPFSLTIHGGQIFYEPRLWALGEKITRSAFTACISDFCRSQCMYFTPQEAWDRLKLVRCAVDERFLSGPEIPMPPSQHVVSVARLAPEKGQSLLVDAVARVARQGIPVRLTLVGDGPSRASLERRIAELGLEQSVVITGFVGSAEVRQHLQSARIFVLSSFTEGLPVSVMEALAQRRPVVATNVGAVAELVRPKETGWLIAPGSVDALAEALAEALRTPPDRLIEMGRRGAALVSERHRAATEIPKLEALFRQAIRREVPAGS